MSISFLLLTLHSTEKKDMPKNLSELSGRKGVDRNLFDVMGKAAQSDGTLSKDQMKALSEEFLFGKGNIFGTTSFYDFLREENKGKKAYVCNGSACLVAGTQDSLKAKLSGHFKDDEIGEMCCLGRCHENNAFWYNGMNYSGSDIDQPEKWKKEVDESSIRPGDHYHVACSGSAVLTSPQPDISSYFSVLEKWLKLTPDEILTQLKESGLRGRGGAGFRLLLNWRHVQEQQEIKSLLCAMPTKEIPVHTAIDTF
jgi:NADH:ubiquinone oxidoreductase subunit E